MIDREFDQGGICRDRALDRGQRNRVGPLVIARALPVQLIFEPVSLVRQSLDPILVLGEGCLLGPVEHEIGQTRRHVLQLVEQRLVFGARSAAQGAQVVSHRVQDAPLPLQEGRDGQVASAGVAGVLPVTRFDGGPIGTGTPGPWTLRAREAREAFIRGEPSGPG